QRQSDSPLNLRRLKARYFFDKDGGQGLLPSFEIRPVIQFLRQAGRKAQVESLGVRNWTYEAGPSGGFIVEQVFPISPPEGRHTLILPVQSSDSRSGEFEGRQWRILLNRIEPREQSSPTPLGNYLRILHADSAKAAEAWGKAMEHRELDAAYLET